MTGLCGALLSLSVTQAVRAQDVAGAMVPAIREEGLKRSGAYGYVSALADGIGARLSGSANMDRAYDWAMKSLRDIGLKNVHLEDTGMRAIQWRQNRAWVAMTTPDQMVFLAQAGAWSVSTKGPIEGDITAVELNDEADLERLRGTLRGKIVLLGPLRDTPMMDRAMAVRYTDEQVAQGIPNHPVRQALSTAKARIPQQIKAGLFKEKLRKFLEAEGVGAVILPSRESEHGGGSGNLSIDEGPFSVRSWNPDERPHFPFAYVAIENFGRAWRLAKAGRDVKLALDLDIQEGPVKPAYNVVADLPGTDPKAAAQMVLAGAHLDSWASGTGALDNASGVASVIEAVRILKAIGLRPRRTIRLVLFGAEEQGLYGSQAYVRDHLGVIPRSAAPDQMALPVETRRVQLGPLKTRPDYRNFSIIYNMDAGSGRVRGVYAGGNPRLASIFRGWIEPLKDLGVTQVFDEPFYPADQSTFTEIGLPGVMFLHDPLEYFTRARHSNLDTMERISREDIAQVSTVLAIFLAQSAMADGVLPRNR
ncbi:M20/M25/M40 family metallo-hydrolase [Sphingobium sp. AP50]|uniref:M20/M25/M40 family metallo-hydrolase n=1 Tax=Sphingobium sp. AP50 TaxID=1884369 RepID=UPI0015A68FF4|nr:M20/M25/M40 family metallo-hydrolase [Sphingobium sp. AP50]